VNVFLTNIIEKILDAARYAPSPENMQMWRYIVIREDQEMKDFIAEISMEMTRQIFGAQPYELTQGRLWYLPDHARPREFEDIRDGSLFTSESFHDAHFLYELHLFGSVVVAMKLLQTWSLLFATSKTLSMWQQGIRMV
jgi:nitroreductase